MIVDSHCHVSPVWFEPVETLLSVMDANGVECALLTQLIGQYDNAYQQECLTRFPGRFASIVAVDPTRPDAAVTLRRLASEGATGVRLRGDARSAGGDPFAVWTTAEACGLAVSCFGPASAFTEDAFAALVAHCPDMPFVIEHFAGLGRPQGLNEEADIARVLELARFDNVYLKVPGLGEFLSRPTPLPASGHSFKGGMPTILKRVLDRFGSRRLMWGSDFPPVASREGYANALNLCRKAFSGETDTVINDIFGDTAARVFGLSKSKAAR